MFGDCWHFFFIMSYEKKDIINAATKLGRLVNGGVIGYYAGGKTSEIMREAVP